MKNKEILKRFICENKCLNILFILIMLVILVGLSFDIYTLTKHNFESTKYNHRINELEKRIEILENK